MRIVLLACLAVVLCLPARANDEAFPEDGKDLFVVCAPCHGPEGLGGSKGDYPRLAGLPFGYIKEQLRAFKARERINIPMFPFTVERELSDQDILDVSAYIANMEVRTRMPDMADDADGYARLLAAKQVLQIPRYPGDVEKGEAVYVDGCERCHGENAKGRASHDDPPLASQYSKYLKKQIHDMLDEARYHPRSKRILAPLSPDDIENLLAYFSTRDD